MVMHSSIRNLFMRPAARPVRRARRRRLAVEWLEDRAVPSTFTVLNTLDDGSAGSLRWAVGQANSHLGADRIAFDSGVYSTPQTITLSGKQLELSDTTGDTSIMGPTEGWFPPAAGIARRPYGAVRLHRPQHTRRRQCRQPALGGRPGEYQLGARHDRL